MVTWHGAGRGSAVPCYGWSGAQGSEADRWWELATGRNIKRGKCSCQAPPTCAGLNGVWLLICT